MDDIATLAWWIARRILGLVIVSFLELAEEHFGVIPVPAVPDEEVLR